MAIEYVTVVFLMDNRNRDAKEAIRSALNFAMADTSVGDDSPESAILGFSILETKAKP